MVERGNEAWIGTLCELRSGSAVAATTSVTLGSQTRIMMGLSSRRGGHPPPRPGRRCRVRRIFLLGVVAALVMYSVAVHRLLRRSASSARDGGGTRGHPGLESPGGAAPRSGAGHDAGKEPVVIAHAVSLIKCSKGPSVAGFLDAAAVLRHSIHRQSVHYAGGHGNSTAPTVPPSRYSYKMYAIVHTSCAAHAAVLRKLGYTILVRDHPIKKDEIRGKWLRDHIEAENCCGSAEFIKLHAYHLTDHPVAVHWDMDVAILKPLDDLYDVLVYPPGHAVHEAARRNIERQHPDEPWPERVDAFLTRDITSAKPWEKVTGVQGGFLVARPSSDAFERYMDFIREGNYVGGRGDGTGWAGLGYGGFQGAMAYQGAVAYYYDQIAPKTAVELNVCRYNQVAADVIWRGPERHVQHRGQCREYPRRRLPDGSPDYKSNTACEDCRVTPIEQVWSAHYTACKKPWECRVAHPRVPRDKKQVYRLENLVNVTYCMSLVKEWFALRRDFEDELKKASGKEPSMRDGKYEDGHFLGYCKDSGSYIPIEAPPDGFDIERMYGL